MEDFRPNFSGMAIVPLIMRGIIGSPPYVCHVGGVVLCLGLSLPGFEHGSNHGLNVFKTEFQSCVWEVLVPSHPSLLPVPSSRPFAYYEYFTPTQAANWDLDNLTVAPASMWGFHR